MEKLLVAFQGAKWFWRERGFSDARNEQPSAEDIVPQAFKCDYLQGYQEGLLLQENISDEPF